MTQKIHHEQLQRPEDYLYAIAELKPGDHLCCIYQTDEEHRAVIIPFIIAGLKRNEKVLYIADVRSAEKIETYFIDQNFDVKSYIENGQFVILTANETYLKEDSFDPASKIQLLKQETSSALKSGYTALRVTGEMSWSLRGYPGSERLIEYETKLNDFFLHNKCLAICQYDMRRFNSEILLNVLQTHPLAIIGTELFDNFYYIPPHGLLGPNLHEVKLQHWLQNLKTYRHSETKIAATGLKKEKERAQHYLDIAGVMLVALDTNQRVTLINRKGCEILGYSEDEIIGKNWFDHFLPVKSVRDVKRVFDQIVGGELDPVEYYENPVLTKEGSERIIAWHNSVVKDDSGSIVSLLSSGEDITERKQAELALRESEASITSIFSAAPIGIGLVFDRVIKRVNEHFCDMVGYSREELIGKNDIIVYATQEEYERVGRVKYEQIKKHGTGTIETKFKRKDGQIIDVLLSSAPLDRNDLSRGVMFTAIDITKRKKMEVSLNESEKLYRLLFNNAPAGIGMSDMKGRVLAANYIMEEITGYNFEEFKKIKLSDTYAVPEEREKLLLQLQKHGSVRDFETQLIRKDGSVYLARLNIDLLEIAGEKVVLTIAQDITESKRMEEALRMEREQLLSIFDSIDEIVYVSDPVTYEVIYMNKKLKKMLKTEGTGELCYKIFQGKNAPCHFCTNKIILENNYQSYQWEHYNPVMKRDLIVTDHIIQWPDGRDVRFEFALDITDRKKAEAGLNRLNRELEQRVKERTAELEAVNKELESFSYSVSHDLRAPLRHVGGFVDLLHNNLGDKLDDKNRHYLDVIYQSTQRMGQLIDELLQFSRTGRAEIIKKCFDSNELLKEVIQEIKHETEGRDITWKISQLPEICADRLKIRQVFSNLISNAIKFTRPKKNPVIEISVTTGEDNEYIFSVNDNGVGFDMKYIDKLFGVFQRLHQVEDFEGTGIGLANVRRIIHRHGGRTWAEGRLDEGATFYFSLPINQKG